MLLSHIKYLDIDSTHRNRSRYINPAQFVLPVTQSGIQTRLNAIDPVSDMAPIVVWNPFTVFTDLDPAGISTNDVIGSSPDDNTITVAILIADNPSQVINFYKGKAMEVIGKGTAIIDDWRYIGRNSTHRYFKVTASPYFSTPPVNGDTVEFPRVTDVGYCRFYVPDDQPNLDNYYVGYRLWNDTKRDSATITGYIGATRILVFDSTVDTHVLTSWVVSDTYVLRKQDPKLFGVLAAGTNSLNRVTLSTAASTSDSFYVNSFVRFSSDSANNALEVRRIIAYDGGTRVATLFPALTSTAVAADEFEILEYHRDNASPICYNGKWISEQKLGIRLKHLILPNNQLSSGANITSYPKLYVRLRNSGHTLATKIYSNNPDSSSMLFQSTISSDIVDPNTSIYIKLYGDDMLQTITFRLNSDIEFGVFLQDGTLYQAIRPDTVAPLEPDHKLQISALFEILPI